jgi:hypothetical protein
MTFDEQTSSEFIIVSASNVTVSQASMRQAAGGVINKMYRISETIHVGAPSGILKI